MILKQFVTLKSGWQTYIRQPTLRPGLAFALLYCTVLSFGTIMTGYCYARGMSEAVLGTARGVGAAFGITATLIFSPLVRRLGVVKAGVLGVWAQMLMLLLCVSSTFVAKSSGNCNDKEGEDLELCHHRRNVELGLLITGVVTSRLGLWGFDLSVSMLLQKELDWMEGGGHCSFQCPPPLATLTTLNTPLCPMQNSTVVDWRCKWRPGIASEYC